MSADDGTPDDRDVEVRMAAYRESRLRRAEEALAADAPEPRPQELADLAAGRIEDSRRREGLAAQLVSGPNWEEQLAHLKQAQSGADRRPSIGLLMALAAAVLLVLYGPWNQFPADALGSARLTGPSGLELRGPVDGADSRVVVEAGVGGWLALVIAAPDGALSAVPTKPPQLWTRAAEGEELILPLTGSVTAHAGQRWVVILRESELDADETLAVARAVLDGETPSGISVQVIPID